MAQTSTSRALDLSALGILGSPGSARRRHDVVRDAAWRGHTTMWPPGARIATRSCGHPRHASPRVSARCGRHDVATRSCGHPRGRRSTEECVDTLSASVRAGDSPLRASAWNPSESGCGEELRASYVVDAEVGTRLCAAC